MQALRSIPLWAWTLAPFAYAASDLPLIPDVRHAAMTGEKLPAKWAAVPSGATDGLAAELAKLEATDATTKLPLRLAVDAKAVTTPEGYRLEIRKDGITVTGADEAGVFYGLKTLRQLVALHPQGVPCGVIEDAPAFPIRGFMHDTGRNFQKLPRLKAQLDRFADYKLNTFHWHLTDRPGWRIECKKYPVLNDPKTRMKERDPDATYSYDEIRELIAYAKARHIRVIPELDMPGHSDFFKKAFGFEMGDPRALPILKDLIAEFCAEIPAADCPILHIGSDEVHIKNPKAFITAICAEVRRHGRTPVIWNPGLPNDGTAIEQIWREEGSARVADSKNAGVIDSGLGYINGYEPWQIARRYWFLQSCHAPKATAKHLGGILCCWPDIHVADKSKIAAQNGVWPATLAFAQNTWHSRNQNEAKAADSLPAPDSPLGREFAQFESRLARHRDTFFSGEAFPFTRASQVVWRTVGPFPADTPAADTPEAKVADTYPAGDAKLAWQTVHGGVIPVDFMAQTKADPAKKLKAGKAPGLVYALTHVYSPVAYTLRAQVGFDTPARSNRQYAGIPAAGTWDANGGAIFLNDAPVPAPAWEKPGTKTLMSPSWATPQELITIEDEELYWTREPASLPLKAGWNKLLVKLPAGYAARRPWFSFFPVKQDAAGRWVEDTSVKFSTEP